MKMQTKLKRAQKRLRIAKRDLRRAKREYENAELSVQSAKYLLKHESRAIFKAKSGPISGSGCQDATLPS